MLRPRYSLFPRLLPTPIRRVSTDSASKEGRVRRYGRYTGYFTGSTICGLFLIGTGILIHDALTYADKHVDRVPVSPLALHPECGGPKNLPVVRAQVDDQEDEEARKFSEKPRLVIIGGGWGVSR